MRKLTIILSLLMGLAIVRSAGAAETPPAKPSLKEAVAALKIPPDYFATTNITWDTNKPWKDARIEIRRLLGLGPDEVRQAVKLTWIYYQKNDIGDGHELSMYLFLSGNYAWATVEFPKYIEKVKGQNPNFAYLSLASCLAHFGEYDKALEYLDIAMKNPPSPPWAISAMANTHSRMGDIYAEMGDVAKAREHYSEAIRLFPLSDQPYGRHLLARNAAKVQTKLDLLTMQSLQLSQLRDGTYIGNALGYSDQKDLEVTLTLKSGKITDVKVAHAEKIELNATKIVPQRIIDKQSLKVDAVTGATVTSQGIIDGAFQALKKAGMQ